MAVLAPFQLGNPISGETFLSTIIISGFIPTTSNGTYTRSSKGVIDPDNGTPIVGDAAFTGQNGNTIEWVEPLWNMYDTQSDPTRQFSNYGDSTGKLNVTDWAAEEGGTVGTATNIYSQV